SQVTAAAEGRLVGGVPVGPGVGERVVDEGALLAPLAAEQDDDLVVAVPGGAAQGADMGLRQRAAVAPGVAGEGVGPDRGVLQVDFSEPRPAGGAAEGGEAQEAVLGRVEDVLLGAADARRGVVGFLEDPACGGGVERPRLGVLLAAAALVVAAPAD